MKTASSKRALGRALVGSIAASISYVSWTSSFAQATATWMGGTDANWSNAANWVNSHPAGVGESLVFRGPLSQTSTINNDLANLYEMGSATFTRGTDVTGMSLRFVDGLVITSANNGQLSKFSCDTDLAGAVFVKNTGSSPVVFQNVIGAGSLNFTSTSLGLIKNASYTGKTIISGQSVVRIGGKRVSTDTDIVGITSNQGDYEVTTGTLHGNGTIGLSSGSRVRIMNKGFLSADLGIGSTQEDRIGDLNVDGGVSIESGGTYLETYEQLNSDPVLTSMLHVNGTLDLSSANDILLVHPTQGTGNVGVPFAIMDYQMRLGQFDSTSLDTLASSNVNITYTSAPGAGPGQVLISVTPEPTAVIALMFVGAGAIATRRRR